MLPATPDSSAPDRRHRSRMRLSYPLRLHAVGAFSPAETETENLSCEGFFCFTEHEFAPGDTLHCELVIPPLGLAGSPEMILRCHAHVVHVIARPGRRGVGIGCRFADYDVALHIDEPMVAEELLAS